MVHIFYGGNFIMIHIPLVQPVLQLSIYTMVGEDMWLHLTLYIEDEQLHYLYLVPIHIYVSTIVWDNFTQGATLHGFIHIKGCIKVKV